MTAKPSYEELERRVRELESLLSGNPDEFRHVNECCVHQRDDADNIIPSTGMVQDITERKRTQTALEKRMIALPRRLDSVDGMCFEDLFNLDDIQHLQDQFAAATGVASIITNTDGTPITRPSNFCRLCNDIIRQTDKGLANCFKSDALLGRRNLDRPTIHSCLSCGLWESGAGISVGGRHIANWLIGQVRDETQTDAKMRAYAREIGADEEAVIEAFHEVPSMTREKFEKVAQALFTLANQLSDSAYRNVQQARFISEKERIERNLQESKIFLENISDIAYVADKQGNVIWVNAAVEQATGLPLEEINGKPFLPLFVESDHASLMDMYQRTLEGESLENTFTFKSGTICHFSCLPKRNRRGDIIGTFGVARDITQRKHAEDALQESEGRFRTIMENIDTIAVQGYGPDGTTQYWNAASERLYGYSQQEAIGRNLLDLIIPSEMKAAVAREMSEMAASGQPIVSGELLLKHKDGSRVPVISHHTIVKVPGRAQELFCLDVDISARKQAEVEKEKLKTQLNQAQKMESVGRLAGGVAHDFNNMLGVIIGHADMLLAQSDPDQPFHTDLTEIREAGRRSADLTRQLLAFARKQIVAPQVIDLNTTVADMTRMLQRLIGEDIDLAWIPGDELWPVKIDPSQVDQILANLCVNARDAIIDVGKVTIETGKTTLDTAYCENHAGFIPGEYVLLAVSDNGSGINPEALANVFEPFFTTKEQGKGTGLGLATVYGAVKQNQGFINVYSEPGQGTTVKIYLPRHLAKAATVPGKEADTPAKGGHETILLVEDEPAILQITTRMLERYGYTVIAAGAPGEAIELAYRHSGEIHLLLTDVVMPEMNGRDLAGNILSQYPDLKRLFMSGYTANAIAHHGVLDEGVNFIQKPFSKKDLKVKVREVLEQE